MLAIDRIRQDIEALSKFNSTPEQGCTRFSYSREDWQARDYLLRQFEQLNLSVTTDGVGNIRARRNGIKPELPPVLIGSHIDTVHHGGKFDGVLGVVSGLEALRVICAANTSHTHPIELVIFAEEEGSNFTSLAGSKALVGALDVEDLKRLVNSQGVSMYQAAKDFGLDPDSMHRHVISPGAVKAMLELHIEQSVVLETEGIPVGIVENVAGGRWLGVTLKGVANHAGATPMPYRKDPMAGAAEIISQVGTIVAAQGTDTTVATVGKIECSPNAPNVIPGEVFFTFDVRDINTAGMENVCSALIRTVKTVAESNGLRAEIQVMGETLPVRLSPFVSSELEAAATGLGLQHKRMNSGALHDACIMAGVTDVGMIFVPSVGGRSHAPEEDTRYQDIEAGAKLLLAALLRLAAA
ncbi:MAG: Zn-dependent hydrolase [Firmicutes bacterium]|nr:Zn-dependent hydrolase [Bacillota bacterium]